MQNESDSVEKALKPIQRIYECEDVEEATRIAEYIKSTI